MSVERGEDGIFRFHYDYNGIVYEGSCHTEDVKDAVSFEILHRASVLRLEQCKTLKELFLKCKDMIIAQNPIYFSKAFELYLRKPRRRVNRKEDNPKTSYNEKIWEDFTLFIKEQFPQCDCIQKVEKRIAEAYISLIRTFGSYRDFRDNNKIELSTHTLNHKHIFLNDLYEKLLDDTGMDESPFARIPKLIEHSESHEPFTFDELSLIFKNADDYLRPLFTIGLFTGLSMGDICTLEKSHISFERNFIIRRRIKTGALCSIPMTFKLRQYIQGLYDKSKDEKYLLPEHFRDYDFNKSIVSNRATRFLASLGIETKTAVDGVTRKCNKKGLHSLRHTFCTLAGIFGIPETIVRSIVGHMTEYMTYLYTRKVSEEEKLRYIRLFGLDMDKHEIAPQNGDKLLPDNFTIDKEEIITQVLNNLTGKEKITLFDYLNQNPYFANLINNIVDDNGIIELDTKPVKEITDVQTETATAELSGLY